MADNAPPAAVQIEAHVAAGTPVNVLRRSIGISGALLWPSWQAPPEGAPADRKGQTGTIQNHWRYKPGTLNSSPQAPAWATAEQIHEGDYPYDKQYPGKPLPNVDIDLFHASTGVDFNDYAAFSKFYKEDDQHDPRVKKLRIKLTTVDVFDAQDGSGAGELSFEAAIDGRAVGKTAEMKARSGQHGVVLAWKDARASVIEIDAAGRSAPIPLTISGVERDTFSPDSMGSITAEIKPPWPTGVTSGTASGQSFAVHWEIEPVLMTEADRAETPPAGGAGGQKSSEDKLRDALIGSRKTGADGRFEFRGLRAGEYVLSARGRFAFIENNLPGGEIGPPPPHHHNGVEVAALGALQGKQWLHLKVKVDANGRLQFLTMKSGAEVLFNTDRLLPPGKTLGDIKEDTPYRFYALPLVVSSNTTQWAACAEELRRAFKVTDAQARTAMDAAAILDVAALEKWECADRSHDAKEAIVIAAGDPTSEILKHTLLLQGAARDMRTMAYDHVYWHFAAQDAAAKTPGRFVPLSDAGFFSGANPLYGLATKTKDTYGRYALRFVTTNLDGRDIRELKTRLILWGSHANFVNLTHDRFDQAVREALLRFKRDREIFRRRVDVAGGTPDLAKSFLTTIVDADTYAALDSAQPPLTLANVASTTDPNNLGTPLLNPDGYCRLVLYASEIARRRLARGKIIRVHSSSRTLAHNRHVYLGNQNLRWRLATNAPVVAFTHPPFPTINMGGVTGDDGTSHNANAPVTGDTLRDTEPRGTYVSNGQGDYWAPDFSKHTRGTALDFCLATPPAAHAVSVPQVQWDTNAIVLFGAIRGQNANGRLWLEPPSSTIAPNAPGAFPLGTTSWIHLDTGDIPVDRVELVLADTDILGPRWNAKLIVRGRVTQAGAQLGARVQLLDGATVLAETYTDRNGDYALRAQAGAAGAGYTVRATFQQPYVFQPPQPVVAAVTASIPVAFAYAGEEVIAADIALPAAP